MVTACVSGVDGVAERKQLERSMQELDTRIAETHEDLAAAFMELKKFEIARDQRLRRERRARAQAEQKAFDEFVLARYREAVTTPRRAPARAFTHRVGTAPFLAARTGP